MSIYTDENGGLKVITAPALLAFNGTAKADNKGRFGVTLIINKADVATIGELEQLAANMAVQSGLNLAPKFSPGHVDNDGDYSPVRGPQ